MADKEVKINNEIEASSGKAKKGGRARYCQMLWMVRERIRRIQAAFFISPSTNGTPWMTWVMSL